MCYSTKASCQNQAPVTKQLRRLDDVSRLTPIAAIMNAAHLLEKGFLEQWLARHRGCPFVVPIQTWCADLMASITHMTHPAGTLPDEVLRVRDIELRFRGGRHRPPPSTDDVIYVHKGAEFVGLMDKTLERIRPKQMIEVGVLDGGSTIYWHHRYDLERLVAFDIVAEAPCFTRYLA